MRKNAENGQRGSYLDYGHTLTRANRTEPDAEAISLRYQDPKMLLVVAALSTFVGP